MKRILTALALCAVSLCALAQGGRIALLDKAKGRRVNFHYSYSVSRNGSDFTPVTDGQVCVEGNAYTLEGLGLSVVSDGTTRWTMDRDAGEVVIEKVQADDIYTNPARFIATYTQYMDRIWVNASDNHSLDVTLTLDKDTRARFILRDITYGDCKGKSDFSLDGKPLPSGYVVTDLR